VQKWILHPISTTFLAICFIIITINYPIGEKWVYLVSQPFDIKMGTAPIIPSVPINRHLTQEDIQIFDSIQNSNFIAPPWKGLVLGTYTTNRPLDTKGSITKSSTLLYVNFMNMNCIQKKNAIKKHHITYVYSANIDCEGFETLKQSAEGLTLYKTI
jgi:hypothetical protein